MPLAHHNARWGDIRVFRRVFRKRLRPKWSWCFAALQLRAPSERGGGEATTSGSLTDPPKVAERAMNTMDCAGCPPYRR